MTKSAFFDAGLPSRDILLGLGASLLVHLIIIAAAIIYPRLTTPRNVAVPFYQVTLVTPQEIQPRAPSETGPKGGTSRPRLGRQSSGNGQAVMPVRRLHYRRSKADVHLKKLKNVATQPQLKAEIPVVDQSQLEKLLPQPPATQQKPAETPSSTATSAPSTGHSDEEIGLAQRLYYTEVWNAIRRRWTLPPSLRSSRLEAVLVLTVRRDGRIVSTRFEKRSGNEAFDESAMRAVRKANPLPPFPEIYSPKRIEIGVRFRPEDRY